MTPPIEPTLKSAPERTLSPADGLELQGLKEVAGLVSENTQLRIKLATQNCMITCLKTQMRMNGIKPIETGAS